MLPTSNDAKKEKLKDVLLGLHWAATTGNVGLIKFALDHGVPIDSAVNGFVPLQLACISDSNIAAVQYLIDRGADVNIQKWSKKHSIDKTQAVPGATGSTALHVACANGCIKIVDLLIRNNARIDVKDKYGSTPLDVAQAKHETEIVKLLKAAREQQRQYKHRSVSYSNDNDENETSRARKSIDSIVMTHKRTTSLDKQPRIRRPSLPSIFEGHHHFLPQNTPSFISMTPSSTSLTTTTHASKYAVVTADGHPDWYAYGVVNPYDDDNYLLSLERRAYNLASNEDGGLERHSQDSSRRPAVVSDSSDSGNKLRTTALKNAMAANNGTSVNLTSDSITPTSEYEEAGYDGKKSWFSGLGKEVGRHSLDSHSRKSLDFRPSFENFTQFAKRGVPNILGQDDDSSDDDERHHHQQQQQRNGFFSRWAPAWSKK
ncbi:ankyrin repeat-containing domain protein [Mucor lusitanicus]|uniref:Ankyrin repeat-containing domain protein n=1 Tax=Mucor circinelloides f. lusitanicus TaxID=29924 RepID=A0A8H4BBF2_MUCCL|nr:ankyrin repeat-containing domain protein [Mucor lusitanicus]